MVKATIAPLIVTMVWNSIAFTQGSLQPADKQETEESAAVQTFVTREVKVTAATGTPRDPVETPGEINIITQEEIDLIQPQSLEDILKYQPGVDVQNGPRRVGELPVIRGLSGPRILTTIDGVRLNFQSGHRGRIFQDMDAFKQIEIVQGPNSALWGSGALGGVVAFTTKDPSDFLVPGDRIGGRLKLGFQGVNDEFNYSPTLFGRIGENFEYLATFTRRRSGDIRLGGDAGKLQDSGEELDSGFGKLVWHITPYDEVQFLVQGVREEGRVPANPAVRTSAPSALVDRNTTEFTYRLGYTRQHPDNPYLNPRGFVYFTDLDISEKRIFDQRQDEISFDTVGLDLRNSSRFGDPNIHHHLFTYGIEWYRDSQDGKQGERANTFFPEADANTLALYIQDEIRLWDRWIIIPGLRWDRWENSSKDQPDRSESQLSPKIGSVVRLLDWLFLEVNYAEGFRAPTFGELFISGTHFPGAVFVPNPDLGPEKSRNIDAGFRIRRDKLLFEQDRFLFRNAYFRNSLRDFIDFEVTFVPPAGPLLFKNINVQEALIEGYEAALEWEFFPGFTFSGNFTYTRGTNETDDQPLASIPPMKGVVGLRYLHIPWGLLVDFRVQIVDAQDRVPEGVDQTPGYTVYDLLASWIPPVWPDFRLDFGIDNLTDKEFRRHLAGIPEAGINPKVSISYTKSW